MFYLAKSSWLIKKFYSTCVWSVPEEDKSIYLSFDDGPHPQITAQVLDELRLNNAKATFFCVGKNVVAYPDIYRRIIEEGHSVGNHTYNHLNGWHTPDKIYLDDVAAAKKFIDSDLFRPPYGRISKFQLKQLALPRFHLKAIMWSVLSGDFDNKISKERCLKNVIGNTKPGSIVVFHDSDKAMDRMMFALKGTLKHFGELGFRFESLKAGII